jgi:hypothetical protein
MGFWSKLYGFRLRIRFQRLRCDDHGLRVRGWDLRLLGLGWDLFIKS